MQPYNSLLVNYNTILTIKILLCKNGEKYGYLLLL